MSESKIREVIPDVISHLRQVAEKTIQAKNLFQRLSDELDGPHDTDPSPSIDEPKARSPTQIEELENLASLINSRLDTLLIRMRDDLNTLLGGQ